MTKVPLKILVVDDEPTKRSILEDELTAAGYSVSTAADPLLAESELAKGPFDVILTDLRMPNQDGLSFLRDLKRDQPDQAVIVMTAYGTVETAVAAMKLGAFDYIPKPFSTEELLLKLDRLLKYQHLASENEALRNRLALPQMERRIIGQSEAIRQVLGRIHEMAGMDTTVLIEGESGTGKELVARTIHDTSHRSTGPFVVLACTSLPADLIESEMFGHEAGAFTGATRQRIGRFELAHGGTLFLDDVDDIPQPLQVKLLRVLQERSFERIGGEELIRVNFRLIAATKRSLATLVAAGKFREDLYYRINVVPLHVPPLRDRVEDIPLLVTHVLAGLAIKMNRAQLDISAAAVKKLQGYAWPGNVRELEHVLERMVALAKGDVLGVDDVPQLASPTSAGPVAVNLAGLEELDLPATVDDLEARLIRWALGRSQGNLARAAGRLGVPRSTLQYKVAKLFPAGPDGSPDYEI